MSHLSRPLFSAHNARACSRAPGSLAGIDEGTSRIPGDRFFLSQVIAHQAEKVTVIASHHDLPLLDRPLEDHRVRLSGQSGLDDVVRIDAQTPKSRRYGERDMLIKEDARSGSGHRRSFRCIRSILRFSSRCWSMVWGFPSKYHGSRRIS